MMVSFSSVGDESFSGWCVCDYGTLTDLSGSQMFPGLFQDFIDGYIKPGGSSQ